MGSRLRDAATWPRAVRNGAGIAWVVGSRILIVALHLPGRTIPIDGGTWGDATSWTRAGDRIAFSISRGERRGTYVIRPDGRGLHRVTAT